jgi:hypothetical protein
MESAKINSAQDFFTLHWVFKILDAEWWLTVLNHPLASRDTDFPEFRRCAQLAVS